MENNLLLLLKGKKYSSLGYRRLLNLQQRSREALKQGLKGCYVEMGCYKGGSGAIVTPIWQLAERNIWLFDSFEGLPEPENGVDVSCFGEEGYRGQARAKREDVDYTYVSLNVDASNVKVIKGWFEKTIPRFKENIGEIGVLHVDCDWESSVKYVLEELYNQVEEGGYIIIDDYGHWKGCKKAVDEFRERNGIISPLKKIDYTGVYWKKT